VLPHELSACVWFRQPFGARNRWHGFGWRTGATDVAVACVARGPHDESDESKANYLDAFFLRSRAEVPCELALAVCAASALWRGVASRRSAFDLVRVPVSEAWSDCGARKPGC
jgi:hypothetical protein